MKQKTRTIFFITFLFATIFAGFLPMQVGAVVTYTEDFNDDTPGAAPNANFYTFTSSGTIDARTSATRPLAGNGLVVRDTTAVTGGIATFAYGLGINMCSQSVTYALNFDTLPSGAGETMEIAFISNAGSPGFVASWDVSDTGAVRVAMNPPGATATLSSVIVVDTWYNVTSTFTSCTSGAQSYSVFFAELDEGATVTTSAICSPADACKVEKLRMTTVPGTVTMYMENMVLHNAPDPPPAAIGSVATVSDWDAGTLTGFDIDTGGRFVIIRSGTALVGGTIGGPHVRTYTGAALTPSSPNPFATNCDRFDGVMSQAGNVLFIFCGHTPTLDADSITIRSGQLGDGRPTNCDPDACVQDMEFDLIFGTDCDDCTVGLELAELAAYPIDWNARGTGGFDSSNVGWAFSTTTGRIGYAKYLGINANDDEWMVDDENYGAEPDQLCAGQDTTGAYYIGAAEVSSPTVIYDVDPGPGVGGRHQIEAGTPIVTVRIGLSSAISQARGLMCAKDNFITVVEKGVGDVDEIWFGSVRTGGTIWPSAVSGVHQVDSVNRGVAISGDAKYVAWVDGTDIILANATGPNAGLPRCSLAVPTGTFYGMKFDFAGQSLWVATTDVVARFAVQSEGCTTPQPVSSIGGDTGDIVPTQTTTPRGFGNVGPEIESALNLPPGGGLIVVSIMLIVILTAFGVWVGIKQGSGVAVGGWAGTMGALGTASTWQFEWLPGKVVFIVVFILACLTAFAMTR